MYTHPEILALRQVAWQFFGTLTFKTDKLLERVRLAMWFALFRTIAAWYKVHATQDLIWVLRIERGELFGRLHFHFLLAGLPANSTSIGTCNAIVSSKFVPYQTEQTSIWPSEEKGYWVPTGAWARIGGGFGQCRLFDPHLGGEDYVTGFCDMSRSLGGADSYESEKFVMGSCELMLSNSLVRTKKIRAWWARDRRDSRSTHRKTGGLVAVGG